MRVAIYARYSSDRQSDASIEDQIEVCRRLADAHGWEIIETFCDRAISGASTVNRIGFQSLKAALQTRAFDIVLCEGLDRLGRRLSDIASFYDQLIFNNVRLHTVQVGEITQLHIGMLGTMSELYLSDLKAKTKRGQMGRVLQGKIPSGKCYGYDLTDVPGERTINLHEAAIIEQIFADYANGKSPRSIAKDLNLNYVKGPNGNEWRDTTIRGQVERGTGLLNNALYIGRLEWNRCSYVKNPGTGKRVARLNPKDQWEVTELPHLQIISEDLWQAAKERQQVNRKLMALDAKGNPLNRLHRKKYLLSGLLRCGHCGGNYTIAGKDRYGCANRTRGKSTCTNSKTITRQALEQRVLSGLKDNLITPELIEVFVKEYMAEFNILASQKQNKTDQLNNQLSDVEVKISSILQAIEDGLYTPSLKDRLTALEKNKASLQSDIEMLENEQAPKAFTPHPNLHELYMRQVARLEEALNEIPVKTEAIELIQSLVDHITLIPNAMAANGLDIEIVGELGQILRVCSEVDTAKISEAPVRLTEAPFSVVAGARFELTTFRL